MSSAERNWIRDALRASDYVTLAVVLCAGLVSLVFVYAIGRETGGDRTAVVQVDGETVDRLELDGRRCDSMIHLKLPRGEGTLEVSSGRIRVLPMPDTVCPLHICSRTGWIERPGQIIACVPNRLVITIEGEEKTHPYPLDATTP